MSYKEIKEGAGNLSMSATKSLIHLAHKNAETEALALSEGRGVIDSGRGFRNAPLDYRARGGAVASTV